MQENEPGLKCPASILFFVDACGY